MANSIQPVAEKQKEKRPRIPVRKLAESKALQGEKLKIQRYYNPRKLKQISPGCKLREVLGEQGNPVTEIATICRTVRVFLDDPDATESSSDEDRESRESGRRILSQEIRWFPQSTSKTKKQISVSTKTLGSVSSKKETGNEGRSKENPINNCGLSSSSGDESKENCINDFGLSSSSSPPQDPNSTESSIDEDRRSPDSGRRILIQEIRWIPQPKSKMERRSIPTINRGSALTKKETSNGGGSKENSINDFGLSSSCGGGSKENCINIYEIPGPIPDRWDLFTGATSLKDFFKDIPEADCWED